MARRGVQVRMLTNSLASSDERVVHAGYLKRRMDLLRAGVQLYELKPGAAKSSLRVRGRFGPGKVSGLHAKVYAVDGARIFVGSFNFDQRSAHLNTEMGLVIDSPSAAKQLADAFETEVPDIAYELRIAPDGVNLQWVERTPVGRDGGVRRRSRDQRVATLPGRLPGRPADRLVAVSWAAAHARSARQYGGLTTMNCDP